MKQEISDRVHKIKENLRVQLSKLEEDTGVIVESISIYRIWIVRLVKYIKLLQKKLEI